MSMYTRLVSGVIFPLQEMLKGHATVGVRKAMEQSQWWNVDDIRRFQLDRLRNFLVDIGHRVPYYRDLFKEHEFDPEGVTKSADLAKLPFLTKAKIRANIDRLKAENGRRLARFNTGGSSGEPLVFFIGNERVSHDVAAKWRATRWWGVDIGDKEIVVWGSPIELGAQDRIRFLRDRIMRTELLPAFQITEASLDGFIDRIRARRPQMLFGYPSSLSYIAKHAERRGITLCNLGIRVAFVTSERLYEDQRETIARVFGCAVANGYGGRDAGFIAHECPAGGMHLTAEDIFLEIVDDDGNCVDAGTSGQIVITHMATGDFPFVRYKTGDIGALGAEPCACGRGLPTIGRIEGRSTDFIVARDGTVMHGLAVVYPIRDLFGIERFKITQEDVDNITVEIVPANGYEIQTNNKIVASLKQRLGETVNVHVALVNDIAPDPSGKFRYVRSLVTTGRE